MAKIRTKNKINWGGFDPSKLNVIEIEIKEISKTEKEVVFLITDTVIAENTYIDDFGKTLKSEYKFQEIRNKRFAVPMAMYDQLYQAVETQIPSTLTPFQKEQLRPKLALLFHFSADKLYNGKCGYNTEPIDWKIV